MTEPGDLLDAALRTAFGPGGVGDGSDGPAPAASRARILAELPRRRTRHRQVAAAVAGAVLAAGGTLAGVLPALVTPPRARPTAVAQPTGAAGRATAGTARDVEGRCAIAGTSGPSNCGATLAVSTATLGSPTSGVPAPAAGSTGVAAPAAAAPSSRYGTDRSPDGVPDLTVRVGQSVVVTVPLPASGPVWGVPVLVATEPATTATGQGGVVQMVAARAAGRRHPHAAQVTVVARHPGTATVATLALPACLARGSRCTAASEKGAEWELRVDVEGS